MRAWLLIALAGCEHGQTPPMDPPSDGFVPVDTTSLCGRDTPIQGELIDWDSSDDDFLGVFQASITQDGDPGVTVSTPPNGRLEFCANGTLPLAFSLGAPGDYLDGTITIDANVPTSLLHPLSFRAITATRAASFFTERGLTFDPDAAQVIVVQTGDATTLTLSGTHGTAQQGIDPNLDGNIQWSVGSSARYVLFPNVTPSVAGVQLGGDPLGPRTVPAVAGQVSLAAVSFIFL